MEENGGEGLGFSSIENARIVTLEQSLSKVNDCRLRQRAEVVDCGLIVDQTAPPLWVVFKI